MTPLEKNPFYSNAEGNQTFDYNKGYTNIICKYVHLCTQTLYAGKKSLKK